MSILRKWKLYNWKRILTNFWNDIISQEKLNLAEGLPPMTRNEIIDKFIEGRNLHPVE